MIVNDYEYIKLRGKRERITACKMCGEKYIYSGYRANDNASYCPNCRKAIRMKKIKEDPRDKYEIRFDNAVEKLKEQVENPDEYEKYIKMARTRQYSYGSIPEAMVAIELLKLGYRIIPQQKIGKYRVDFVLKDEKIVIEVDGSKFHGKITEREGEIQLMLGFDWKIIHIPAELISRRITKLSECIEFFR